MSSQLRADGRTPQQMREVTIERGWSAQAEGSALISFGATKVLCTASFTPGVPPWLRGQGKGWVTAEYSMLPRSTNERMALLSLAASTTMTSISSTPAAIACFTRR